MSRTPSWVEFILIGVFLTSLVTAQLISSKLLAFTLPVIGAIAFPGGTFAYAFTFLATDTMGELYGEEYARKVVNVGFGMNFVMLALVWATISSPAASGSIDPGIFREVLGSGTAIVLGSLAAYVVSQNWDVTAFHRLRRRFDGRRLWLRNIASTASSQLLDTVIFTAVAFLVAPAILGVGVSLPLGVIGTLIVGQFTAKFLIAVADTPVVYAIVGRVRDERNATEVSKA